MASFTPKKNLIKPAVADAASVWDTELPANFDVLDNAILDTLGTAAGDLAVWTASGTVARLGVGSNDQVLVADSTVSAKMAWKTVQSTAVAFPLVPSAITVTPTSSVANRPAAGTADPLAGSPIYADLTGYSSIRMTFMCTDVFTAGTKISLVASLDGGSSWQYMESSGTGIELAADVLDTNTSPQRKTSWVTLASALRTEIDIRGVFYNTGTATSGIVRHLWLHAR